MKQIIIALCSVLMLSLSLNIKYEYESHLIKSKIDSILYTTLKPNKPYQTDSLSPTEQAWENCLKKLSINSDIVFYGDSHTKNSDFRQYFPEISICNLGQNGDSLKDLIQRVQIIETVHPKKIFFMGGINGSYSMKLEEYKQQYDTLFALIQSRNPNSKLYIESLLPVNPKMYYVFCDNKKVKQINEVLKEVATKHHLVFIDLYSVYAKNDILPMELSTDGAHLKEDCYNKWANAIRRYVYE